MTDKQIKHMVNRFLAWRLPENFNPDAGISFKAAFNEHTTHPMKHQPVGTNLFDADQAEEMVRHMIDGMPRGSSKDDLLAEPKLIEELAGDRDRLRMALECTPCTCICTQHQMARWLESHQACELVTRMGPSLKPTYPCVRRFCNRCAALAIDAAKLKV